MIDLAKPNHKPTIHIYMHIHNIYLQIWGLFLSYVHIYVYRFCVHIYICVCVYAYPPFSGHIWGWFVSVPHQSVYFNFMLQGIGLSKTHGKPWFLESQIGFSFKIPLKPI